MITEKDLAAELGVSRTVIRDARRVLGIQKHAVKNAATLDQEEADAVRGYLGCPPTDKNAAQVGLELPPITVVDDVPAAAGPGEVKNLRVHRRVLNQRIILAADGNAVVRVRVRNSENFLPGMLIPVRHIQGDLYELARACPRSRGRW
jgi:hypothetical protein